MQASALAALAWGVVPGARRGAVRQRQPQQAGTGRLQEFAGAKGGGRGSERVFMKVPLWDIQPSTIISWRSFAVFPQLAQGGAAVSVVRGATGCAVE